MTATRQKKVLDSVVREFVTYLRLIDILFLLDWYLPNKNSCYHTQKIFGVSSQNHPKKFSSLADKPNFRSVHPNKPNIVVNLSPYHSSSDVTSLLSKDLNFAEIPK